MVDRRTFLRGAAAGVAVGPDIARSALAQSGALVRGMPASPNIPYENAVSALEAGNYPTPALDVHVPDEVWELRDKLDGPDTEYEGLQQRAALNIIVLKSVKDTIKQHWIKQEHTRLIEQRRAQRKSIEEQLSTWAKRLGLMDRWMPRNRRDSRFW